jgi:hypothetical protein
MKTLLVLLCLSTLPLRADVTGTILGNVRDASGAALVGVKVAATNVETNLSQQTVTSAAGEYRFLSLPAGTYRVEAELSGFQKFLTDNIVLNVDERRRVDIALKVGSVQERIEVSAAAVQVETTSTQLGTVIDERIS